MGRGPVPVTYSVKKDLPQVFSDEGKVLSKKAISLSKSHKLAADGQPLARVPHDQTIHRIVWSPLLSFGILKDFVLCGGRPGGSAPKTPATFEKVDETFELVAGSPVLFRISSVRVILAAGVKSLRKTFMFKRGQSASFLGQPQCAACPPQA